MLKTKSWLEGLRGQCERIGIYPIGQITVEGKKKSVKKQTDY